MGPGPVTLRMRLVGAVILALLLTLIASSVAIYWHAIRKVDIEMRAAITVGSRIAQISIERIAAVSDRQHAMELLVASFDGDRHLKASYSDGSTSKVLSSRTAPPDDPVPAWLLRLVSGTTRQTLLPIPSSPFPGGHLRLETEAVNEVGEAWNDAKLLFSVLAATCAAALLLIYFVVGRALRPLSEVMAACARVGAGEYGARVRVGGAKEVVLLEEAFNNMTSRLADVEDRAQRLDHQLAIVQEEERIELARNLHDDIGPVLFSIDVDATMIRSLAADGRIGEVDARASSIQEAVGDIKDNVRTLLGRLRPAGLASLDLKGALANIVAGWHARAPDIRILLDLPNRTWGEKMDAAILAIVRESLANAIKHGRPREIAVSLSEQAAGMLLLQIRDDGGGLAAPTGGYGIIGMKERAALLGGEVAVIPCGDPAGVIVQAKLPFLPPRIEPSRGNPT